MSNLGFASRKPLALILVALVTMTLLTVTLPVSNAEPPADPPAWYDTSWLKRRQITIDNTLNPNNLAGYQVRIDVNYDSDMKSDFSDLRFTDSDGVTLIPHWIESYTPSGSALVWVRVLNVPASSTTTVFMYYGNPTAVSASDGTATFEFFDDFTGDALNPSKWTEDVVGDITQSINNYFRFEEAAKSGDTYWIYDGTDTGSQHQAKWTPTSQFITEFKSRINDITDPERAEAFLGLVAPDNTVIGCAGHQDWHNSAIRATRGVVTENTASSVGTGVVQWGTSMSYRSVSPTDATNWKIINDGNMLKFYDDSGFFAEATTSSSVSKLALIAGAYAPNAYLDYVQMNDIRVRKYASPEPLTSIGPEEDYRMKAKITWWDPAWLYRKPINITGNSGSALTNYQVGLIVDHVASKMNPDFSDLRFTDSDQVTPIPHWIESFTSSVAAKVWVKVLSIPASGNRTIYMYYGNPAATGVSSGTDTFEFYEDFETVYGGPSQWVDKQPLPIPKADPSVVVYNGKLYVFGGYYEGTGDARRETYEYDPLSNSWTRKADMPTARWGPIAVEYDGKAYVIGGTVNVNEVYDLATDTWSTRASPPSGFNEGIMGVRYGNKIHLFYRWMHYEYDPTTDTYAARESPPTGRIWATTAVVGNEIYLIGGYTGSVTTNVNEVYDPATDTWTTRTPMPISKYGGSRENPVINGNIYVTHGRNSEFYVNNYVYNTSTDTWKEKSPGIHPRAGPAGGVINNKLYVIGGVVRDGGTPIGLDYNEEYDPATDTWTPSPWTFSDPTYVNIDASAKYEGEMGLEIYENVGSPPQFAEHPQSFSSVAVDLYWEVTDKFGTAPGQPQGRIALADSADPSLGSLYYFHDSGAKFYWYSDGVYTYLQDGNWDEWYSIAIVWNGASSKVIIGGTEHSVSAAQVSSDRIHLDAYGGTKMFVDVVRVRKTASPEPTVTYGNEETPATIETCDSAGVYKVVFYEADSVYVKGHSLRPNTDYNLYVVNDVGEWNEGAPIPTRVLGTANTVSSDESGNIPLTVVWSSALIGKYDIVLDVFENGLYDSAFDAIIEFDVNPIPIHDIAIVSLLPSKTIVGQGYSMLINVTVADQGNVPEEFSLTVYANSTTIKAKAVALVAGETANISFSWNTTDFAKSSYTITAYVTPVVGETDTADNSLTHGMVRVVTPGDVNCDGRVDLLDAGGVSAHWSGPPTGPLDYDPNFDIENDGEIGILDAGIVSSYWTGPPKGPRAP